MKTPPETWPQDEFDRRYKQMQELSNELQQIVAKLKPAKGYIMAAEGAGYAAIFAAVGGSKANAEVRKAGNDF